MKVIVQQNQTIQDVSTMYTGNSANVLAILLLSGKTDAALLVGEQLIIPDALISNKYIKFYESIELVVGTSPIPLDESEWQPDPVDPGLTTNVRLNGTFFTTNYGTINVPVLNTESDTVPLIIYPNNKAVVEDTLVNIYINGVLQQQVNVPSGKDETINLV